MPKRVDIAGQRFGKLVAVRYDHTSDKSKLAVWECHCDCGKTHYATAKDLRSGNTKSCGCHKSEVGRAQMFKDGRTKERLNKVWYGMMNRCYNKNTNAYNDYGGRGITVCADWHDYTVFRAWALENGYDENATRGTCTIDRIDNDNGYSPENCHFVSMSEQSKNRRKWKQPKQRKSVIQIESTTDSIVATFDSVAEAADTTGADPSSIVRCCKGKQGTTKGFKWMYSSNVESEE